MYIKENKAPARTHPKARTCGKQKKKQVVIIGFISHFGASTEFTIEVICHPPPHTRKYTSRGWKMTYTKTPEFSTRASLYIGFHIRKKKIVCLDTKRIGRVERVIPRTSINCDKPRLGNHQKTSPHGKLVATSYRFSSSLAGHSEYYCGLKVVA